MAFQKGQSGNPNGRKKGTQNKTTKELREVVKEIVFSNFTKNKISKDISELSPKTRLQFFLKLLEHTLPKPIMEEEKEEKETNVGFVQDIIRKMNIRPPENKNSNNE